MFSRSRCAFSSSTAIACRKFCCFASAACSDRLHTRNTRLQPFDARRQRRELLRPIVARALHLMMTALRFAELPVEIAEALLLGPEPRLVVALQVPQRARPSRSAALRGARRTRRRSAAARAPLPSGSTCANSFAGLPCRARRRPRCARSAARATRARRGGSSSRRDRRCRGSRRSSAGAARTRADAYRGCRRTRRGSAASARDCGSATGGRDSS